MKYMLLIYGNEEGWSSIPPDEMSSLIARTDASHQKLRESGEFVGAYGVAEQEHAKMVVVRDGVPVVTDGPFVEAKEYLGSFTIVDCESLERALEIAALNPASEYVGVEVRALMHEAAPEM